MGRPINKRYFGEPGVGTGDLANEFKVRYRATGEVEADGWIVKQVGSKRFKCTDGTNPMTCTLADKNSGTLAVGDMTITVKEGSVYSQITKITGRRVTLGDTGVQVAWDFTGDGAVVEMEEAGTDTSFTDADNFEA